MTQECLWQRKEGLSVTEKGVCVCVCVCVRERERNYESLFSALYWINMDLERQILLGDLNRGEKKEIKRGQKWFMK